MSEKGTLFTDNIVFYDNNASPASIEFPESDVRVNAREKVPNVSGFNKGLLYRFFPGIPPEHKPVHFTATYHTEWAHGETVVATGESIFQPCTRHCLPLSKGPFSDEKKRIITLRGTKTNQAAIFEEDAEH